MIETVLTAPTVSCGHCKAAIESALSQLEGVKTADVDVDGKRVAVRYDEAAIGREAIVTAIQHAGYAVTEAPGEAPA